jgi:chromosome segregation ATPase
MDTATIYRTLAILEERYKELRESGGKLFIEWSAQVADLQQQLDDKDSLLKASQAHQDDLQQQLDDKDSLLKASQVNQADLQRRLSDFQVKSELTLLRLQQVQEELEHYSSLQSNQVDLNQLLTDKDNLLKVSQATQAELQRQLSESHEEVELTLLQLHQAQEELEHYFSLAQNASDGSRKHIELLQTNRLEINTNWKISRSIKSNKMLISFGKKIFSATHNN